MFIIYRLSLQRKSNEIILINKFFYRILSIIERLVLKIDLCGSLLFRNYYKGSRAMG